MTFRGLQTQLTFGADSSRQFKVCTRGKSLKPPQTSLLCGQTTHTEDSASASSTLSSSAAKSTSKSTNQATSSSRLFTGKVRGKVHLAKTANQIVKAIQDNPNITIPDFAKSLDVTERDIEKQIKALRESNAIHRIDPAKGGHWEVIEK